MQFDRDELDELSIAAQVELRDGSADRAADMFRQLVAAWTAIEGPDGEKALNWRGWVGQCLLVARRYEAAEEVLGPLLEDRVRVLGPDDSSVLVARGNLAKAIGLSGRHDEALLILEQLLVDRVRLLGAEDESTLSTRGNIAEVLVQAGRVEEAIGIYEALLDDRIRILGETHHHTAITEDNLWSARLRLPDPTAAITEMLERARSLEAEFGDTDLDVLVTYAKAGEALMRIGDFATALDIIERVVDGRTTVIGPDDPRTLSACRLQARALAGLERFDEAAVVLDDIVICLDRLNMDDGAEAALTLLDLLSIRLQQAQAAGLPRRSKALRDARKVRDRVIRIVARFEPSSSFRVSATNLSKALDQLL